MRDVERELGGTHWPDERASIGLGEKDVHLACIGGGVSSTEGKGGGGGGQGGEGEEGERGAAKACPGQAQGLGSWKVGGNGREEDW